MSFTHSIMFHHFHSAKHLPAQGSLNADEFNEMLDWLSKRHSLIGANEYLKKFNEGALSPTDICLSFDDALLCQYDIVLPILSERKLDAFFFVYSSVFSGNPDNLEIFRFFRTNSFTSMDEFYSQFFEEVLKSYNKEFAEHESKYARLNYLDAFPFYTASDKWFRYLRDLILGPEKYEKLMFKLMKTKNFDVLAATKGLWMSESQLKEIVSRGHLVGLHSYSHPTKMSSLSYSGQLDEYQRNLEHLQSLVGDVVSQSHPCGDYNDNTLKILSDMGIQIGFRSSLSTTVIRSKLEIPRDDHANILKAMRQ